MEYKRKVTFTKEEIGPRFPEGYSFAPELHRKVGDRYVPFYIDAANFPKLKKTTGENGSPTRPDAMCRYKLPKNSLAYRKGIHYVEIPFVQYQLSQGVKFMIPVVAARKDGETMGKMLIRPGEPPIAFSLRPLSRGIHKIPDFPDGFGKKMIETIDSLKPGARVLVVGSAFGKPLAELNAKFPDMDFTGIDAHDWVHALPEIEKGVSEKNINTIRNSTVIADASPDKNAGTHSGEPTALPFHDGAFDAVIMHTHTFRYFDHPLDTIAELFRVTKKGGPIIGHFDNPFAEYYAADGKKLSLETLLKNNFGAKVIEHKIPYGEDTRTLMELRDGKTEAPVHLIISDPAKRELESEFAVNNNLKKKKIILAELSKPASASEATSKSEQLKQFESLLRQISEEK